MLRRKERLFSQIMLAADLVTLGASWIVAWSLRRNISLPKFAHVLHVKEYAWTIWVILPTWVIAFRQFKLYESRTYESPRAIAKALIRAQAVGGLILSSSLYLIMRPDISRPFVVIFVAVSSVFVFAEKIAVKGLLDHLARRRRFRQAWKVLVVGDASHAEDYRRLLNEHPHWGVEIAGIFSPATPVAISSNSAANGHGYQPVHAGPQSAVDWRKILSQFVVDEVVAVSPWEQSVTLQRLADRCAERGIIFRLLVKMPEPVVGSYHVDDLEQGRYMVSLETVPQEFAPLLVKRAIDIVSSIAGLIVCGLVFPWYAWRLRKESPGSVMFKQQRGGQNGRVFTIYKFRTMYLDAEERREDLLSRNEMKGTIFKIKDDPRVTPTGKSMRRLHLDELPQFWNVLKGDMSLVGARPCPMTEVSQYSDRQSRRLSMKPGITGPWQLSGNGEVDDFEEIVKLDCLYIDSWSLWLDCKIIAKTALKVVQADGW